MAREVDGLERNLLGLDDRLEGRIRLTLPDVMASHLLMDDLAAFSADQPEITLEMIPTHQALDIGRRDADVAVRVTSSPPEHLIGRSLGRFSVAPYVHRNDTRTPRWIGSLGEDDRDAAWREQFCPAGSVVMRCDSPLLRLRAVRAGAGIAMLPCALADVHPELERCVPEPFDGGEIWLLTHPDLRSAARIRALLDHLSAAFRRHGDALLGNARLKAA